MGSRCLAKPARPALSGLSFSESPLASCGMARGSRAASSELRVGHAQVDIHRDTHDVPYQMFRGKCACVSQAQLALRPTHPYRRNVAANVKVKSSIKPKALEGQFANIFPAREERTFLRWSATIAVSSKCVTDDTTIGVGLRPETAVGSPARYRLTYSVAQSIEIQLATALGQATPAGFA